MKTAIFVILLIVWQSSFAIKNQYSYLSFENYSTSEGLSSSTCTNIFQDSDGFIWFGTIDGLNLFNGYEFKVFRPVVNDVHSISNNRINSITEDYKKQLWIATNGGVNIFSKLTKKFYRISIEWENHSSEHPNYINQVIYDDNQNIIWFSCKQGIGMITDTNVDILKTNKLKAHLFEFNEENHSVNTHYPTIIYKDKELWIITEDRSVHKFNYSKLEFGIQKQFSLSPSSIDFLPTKFIIDNKQNFLFGNSLRELHYWIPKQDSTVELSISSINAPIFNIYQDSKSRIWISTDGYGLYLLDAELNLIAHIKHNPSIKSSLPNNQPSYVLESKDGLFWIASYNKGFSKLDFSQEAFGHIAAETNNPKSLSGTIVQAVLEDCRGNIWIGTDGYGLNKYNEKTNTFEHLSKNSGTELSKNKLSSDKILHLMQDHNENIWISTWDGGINKYNPHTKQINHYEHHKDNTQSIGQNTAWYSLEDRHGDIWVGTQSAGINILKIKENKFIKYTIGKSNCEGLISNFIFTLFIDNKNRLLVGTDIGFCYAQLPQEPITEDTKLSFSLLPSSKLYKYRVNYIFQDSLNNIWIGTDLGLHKLDNKLQLTQSYTAQDGLPSNIILGIVQDNDNFLWLTTKNGIARLNPNTNNIHSFNTSDGVQDIEFQSKSIYKTQDGRIIAGGMNGFNLFNPLLIVPESKTISPRITDIKINNKSIQAYDTLSNRVLFTNETNSLKSIILKHNENQISFSFVALNYSNPEKMQYSYQLEGIDANKLYTYNSRSVNYPNLPAGDYTFKVNTSIGGKWISENEKTIQIHIKTAPWLSWYAFVGYLLLILGVLSIILKYYYEKNKEKREHEIDQMKLQFFMNVSHEFRTPLTLILSPLEQLEQAYDNPQLVKEASQTIRRSAMRLYSLINQILDLRKIDLDKGDMLIEQINLRSFSSTQVDAFRELAAKKNINISYFCNEDIYLNIDSDKLEKIYSNLLSNAVKFTGNGGLIQLKVQLESNSSKGIIITIADNGIGISPEQQANLFKRFYHGNKNYAGTGIGLNYVKTIVNRLNGSITASSELGKGTTFEIRLPAQDNYQTDLTKAVDKPSSATNDIIKATEYELLRIEQSSDEDQNLTDPTIKYRVLVVEDNYELRLHIKKELQKNYIVKSAENGEKGIEQAAEFCPDIIVSDVKMPIMDGFEMCKQLKSNIATCHIPIILLTARAHENDKLEGYELGADSYITKPFSFRMLKTRIHNILEARQTLKKRYIEANDANLSQLATNSLDEQFIERVVNCIAAHMENQNFNIEILIEEIGISRSQLARKIESITGQNTSSFIRTVRLNKASQLLCTNQHTIKEVAYLVGFNSPAYFSKTFKELYNQTPNEFIESQMKNKEE